MSIELNHTIVHARDRDASASFLAGILGLRVEREWGPFRPLRLGNGVELEFVQDEGPIQSQHYAFLVGEDDFDAIWDRLKDQGRQWWADPHKRHPGEINHEDGGRGLYWLEPSGHLLELITRHYGSG